LLVEYAVVVALKLALDVYKAILKTFPLPVVVVVPPPEPLVKL
jgi:hypothetical protein